MGIESDQLVYDYLSRVGDLAQQHQLSSGARMRLVAALRTEIDRQRGSQATDSPAAVRRIIGRLGTPDELVAAAAGSADGTVTLPGAAGGSAERGPEPRGIPRPRRGTLRKESSRKGASQEEPGGSGDPGAAAGNVPAQRPPSPPHMAGTDELGASGSEPDWWRIEPGPFGEGVEVPGFVGGVEIAELLKQPRQPAEEAGADADADGDEDEDDSDEGGDEEGDEVGDEAERGRWRLRRRAPREGRGLGFSHPLLLLAAVLLVTGALTGSWVALAGGWLLAYGSRTLSRTEAKLAAMWLPGAVAAGGLVWLWGRLDGRWGEPIPQDGMAEALSGVWPVVVRGAAVASAVFLVWRARRVE
ncbi:hypothetical protein LRD69_18255 [Streptomyces sp. JH14]|uniref:hypothetical protein n=1 Tax=Streptomyces sp. JH14 TaxID=2793630 RepID=UPI0023F767CD|nr:hypothetical protein [Streptomyces sp. JH14]MDF6044040.1 hypothetical protein [Streptomyces sp. JH14]